MEALNGGTRRERRGIRHGQHPRAELDSLKAEVKRLRREVGRNLAKARVETDPGPGDDAPTFSREQLAEASEIG